MASPDLNPDPPLDFLDEVVALKYLVGSLGNHPMHPTASQFVKKLD
jgi:hypothetical protein